MSGWFWGLKNDVRRATFLGVEKTGVAMGSSSSSWQAGKEDGARFLGRKLGGRSFKRPEAGCAQGEDDESRASFPLTKRGLREML